MDETRIYRFLSGEFNEQECRELIDWVNASESNRLIFSELKNTWTVSRRSVQMTKEDIQKEYDRFLTRRVNLDIPRGSVTEKAKNIYSMGYYLLRIAAVLLLIYGVGITYLHLQIKDNQEYNEIFTRRGEKSQLVLSDGTKIWINSDSHIRYPTSMNKNRVVVNLDGEAYFDVAKVKGRKFVVNASDLDITALGTSFNVKAYKADGIIETTLEEGKVRITGDRHNTTLKSPLILLPNQRITIYTQQVTSQIKPDNQSSVGVDNPLDKSGTLIEKPEKKDVIIQDQINTTIYTSWKDGNLQFRKEKFADLALLLERWYDVKILITDEELKEWQYTGTFDKETIEQALTALSMSMPFSYSINKNCVIIEK
jgi:transmembrane sensor